MKVVINKRSVRFSTYLGSFKMPFHCASKMIPSEISISGDYLRLESNKLVGKFARSPGIGPTEFAQGRGI